MGLNKILNTYANKQVNKYINNSLLDVVGSVMAGSFMHTTFYCNGILIVVLKEFYCVIILGFVQWLILELLGILSKEII